MPSKERRLPPLSPSEEGFVRELGRVMMALPRVIDTDMVRDARIPLSEYTALMHLSEAPGRHMRMSELAAICNLSLSGMTRVVNRLEKQGLIQRAKCDEDGRGWNAVLTDAGLERLEEAWPTHLASVRRHILDHLGEYDLANLTSALQYIATTPGPAGDRHA
ncbi:MarR family winged helix-turn-helix transcriptional regulator [Streptomyces chiangmaiensis]|uniref:MarR family winged helix-turn-helix transcriptional regulator n=1 Tax=Streptomyces chiangmaiensis TaxID=766497 RepID=A0ABU7FNN9_9ACTN|nr:MarR family winged helix-turn-helix transcriptional regulator [Streptomyces chiangmaiensis]MED7825741.1 MarR family winged helix-turn-helix transcriptional regulator [Streptomyces chiangmaiensis]